jgi:hypothetical protein
MLTTYEDSVLAAAGDDGTLSLADCVKLLDDHGCTMADLYADPNGVDPVALDARDAEAILHWLGY